MDGNREQRLVGKVQQVFENRGYIVDSYESMGNEHELNMRHEKGYYACLRVDPEYTDLNVYKEEYYFRTNIVNVEKLNTILDATGF